MFHLVHFSICVAQNVFSLKQTKSHMHATLILYINNSTWNH